MVSGFIKGPAYVPNRLVTEGAADTAAIYCPYDSI